MKATSEWNKDLGIKFTVQDPCQLVRKSLGDPVAEDLRFVVKSFVGEENFIDMTPNRSNNFCCGGGGGFLQSGFPEARRYYGRRKFEQIMRTGATYAITPCHNCHAQIHDLAVNYVTCPDPDCDGFQVKEEGDAEKLESGEYACKKCGQKIDKAHYDKERYHTVHLWTIICLALGILGENEREYLGPDLKELGL